MEKKNFSDLMTRRKFLERSIGAAMVYTVAPALILRSRPANATSFYDVGEPSRNIDGKLTWKDCSDLSKTELEKYTMDLMPWEKTPRDKKYSYVSAKLEPPYTATEIIYMMSVGQYFPWWTHESAMGGMTITSGGGLSFYTGQQEVWSALTPDTLKDYLCQWPENKIYMWIFDRYYRPNRVRYKKLLGNVYRCGETQKKYADRWQYEPELQKTLIDGQAQYSDYYWDRDFFYGDTIMIPWYYTWRFLGTDVLYNDDTVRFPKTRKEINIRNWDEKSIKADTSHIKMMGDDYPAYNENGGVPCYVLEGLTNSKFFNPRYRKLILWIDTYAYRELRRERYDLDNNLVGIMEAKARLELKDRGKWGYSNLIYLAWDLKNDHMSVMHYDFHRPPRTFKVDPLNPGAYFRPNPLFMEGQSFPVPASAMVFRGPDKFYLRPKLMFEKFPQDRTIQLSDKLLRLIKLQNEQRKLVFL